MNYNNKIYNLIFEIEELFYKYHQLTISQIKNILDSNGYCYNLEEINLAVNILLADFGYGKIKRDDYWSKESIYKYIEDKYYHDSSYSRHYYSFEVDNNRNKKFLLISDTHIGDLELENFEMLQNIYAFAKQQGVEVCFHLGDIFSGKCLDDSKKILCPFDLFAKKYPNEIRTFALIGNHDEQNNTLLYNSPLSYEYALRQTTRYVSNFHVIPRKYWQAKFSNISFHFSHKFYYSWILPDKKLLSIDEINSSLFKNYCDDVLISGHLHNGFLYNNSHDSIEQLYIGVPSTSNFNKNKTVGYIVSLNYNELDNLDNMNITLLISDNDKIKEGETVNWNFYKKNKIFKKFYN